MSPPKVSERVVTTHAPGRPGPSLTQAHVVICGVYPTTFYFRFILVNFPPSFGHTDEAPRGRTKGRRLRREAALGTRTPGDPRRPQEGVWVRSVWVQRFGSRRGTPAVPRGVRTGSGGGRWGGPGPLNYPPGASCRRAFGLKWARARR